MRSAHTALATSILTPHDCDRPDPDDPMIQAIAKACGVAAEHVANVAEETALTIFTRTGERAPLEDIIATMHAVIDDWKRKHQRARRKRRR